ncbi:hypothetical protein SODALDRAFT_109730 [Sodiomyces alkalinus F11]|uniref:Uncharacterized protein n=1 Tax=Sodiomyces alkalinus (strain CBS 110278 / VKM F-3762 / F11) TaxID=1314773 RepID=A0A3N2Q2M3_SODAK|nr:hypothetical protein SODALDRAFT_109730 [Sodiomyces alkalinus F11]ROT41019.1 hypothetical protein SODALDRAFT_109730 [Sodiomyces alkalinus F11]
MNHGWYEYGATGKKKVHMPWKRHIDVSVSSKIRKRPRRKPPRWPSTLLVFSLYSVLCTFRITWHEPLQNRGAEDSGDGSTLSTTRCGRSEETPADISVHDYTNMMQAHWLRKSMDSECEGIG